MAGAPVRGRALRETLEEVYRRLLDRYGPQRWWPAEDGFEMVVGAILTQSTAWVNVRRAIERLRVAGLLDPAAMAAVDEAELAEAVRPSGYFRQKARKLKAFSLHLAQAHGGSLASLFHVKLPGLREELLGIWGIGPETADAIVLYGAEQPAYVVDAYTARVFSRLGLARPAAGYGELQRLFMGNLPPSVPVFQEYHALIVAHGKRTCRRTPRCEACPLLDLCPTGVAQTRHQVVE